MESKDVQPLVQRAIRHAAPFYRHTDKAHQLDHIRSVVSNVIRICHLLEKREHLKLAIIAAVYHDIYSTKELRSVHHLKSFNWILDNKPILERKYKIDYDDCLTVAYACLEHRGSHKGNYNSIVSEIVAAADRGIPSKEDVDTYIGRSYLYARDNLGLGITDSKFHAIKHIQEKFGVNAYAKAPDWYHLMFAERIEERNNVLAMLDMDYFTPTFIADLEAKL